MSGKRGKDDFSFAFKNDIPLGKHSGPAIASPSISFKSLSLIQNLYIEKRIVESRKIMEKFQERIPVIIERHSTEKKLPELEQQK